MHNADTLSLGFFSHSLTHQHRLPHPIFAQSTSESSKAWLFRANCIALYIELEIEIEKFNSECLSPTHSLFSALSGARGNDISGFGFFVHTTQVKLAGSHIFTYFTLFKQFNPHESFWCPIVGLSSLCKLFNSVK